MALFPDGNKGLVRKAEEIAGTMRKVKTHQLRRIYESVSSIYLDSKDNKASLDRVFLLKPQLAYAADRERGLTGFKQVLTELIDRIKTPEELKEFYDFVQSVLAYHGGTD